MNDLILHPSTRALLEAYIASPAHALILTGPAGSGKRTTAIKLAEAALGIQNSLVDHPYALMIEPDEGKAIGIDSIRQLEQFLALKVPGKNSIDRAVIIENAHLLTVEAQNALLKTLEEPPAGTILVLTAANDKTLLPTIRSRAQTINLNTPKKADLEAHFTGSNIEQAYAITGGLPGLMSAMISDEEHPLMMATAKARQLLGQTVYERLRSVEELSKQRQLALDTIFILKQMAHISLQKADGKAAAKWQNILTSSYDAAEEFNANGQPKLALTKLMLTL